MARNILCRLSPLFWLAATGLAAAHQASRHLHFLGWIVILAGLGMTGSMCGAIEATDSQDKDVLLDALLASRPAAERPARDLHALP